MENPRCIQCKHYQVTFEKDRQHSCKLYQFKSKMLPSLVVKKESGSHCQGFESKRAGKEKSMDLNDPRLW